MTVRPAAQVCVRRSASVLSGFVAAIAVGILAGSVALMALAADSLAQDDWNAVTLSDSVISFGAVTTGGLHAIAVTITNDLDVPVEVIGAAFDEPVFSTDLMDTVALPGLEIPPQSSHEFHVYFSSEQNVDYTDFLRIELDRGVRPLVAEVSAQAQCPDSYYSVTRNKWAQELKTVLTDLIDGHTSLGYTTARDSMYGHIDNVGGWVECVYTGRKAFFNTRAGATANGFNCEHTWPQSFSGDAEPMRSDIFHLYPTDETANSKRANLDFGPVTSVSWTVGGSKLGNDAQGQLVFEPRDVHKGNVARTIFYYIIRYNGAYNQWQNPSKLETWLRAWHVSDPPDSAEEARNQHIYVLQHNRNPFIDHPELADRISSFFGTAVRDLAPELAVAPQAVCLDTVGFDSTVCYYVALANSGSDTLDVSSITSTNPAFVADKASLNLAPESYEYVGITYVSGQSALNDSTRIVILSNDADESTVEIPVSVVVVGGAGVGGGNVGGTEPRDLRLYQNSPNPFGQRTTIAFDLDRAGDVDLAIYNIHGQLVSRVLRNQSLPAGEHHVAFSADGLPSGIYYYRLAAGERVLTKSMLLLGGRRP